MNVVRRVGAGLALGALALATLATPAAAAQRPLAMNINLSLGCVSGSAVSHSLIKVTIRARDNSLKDKDVLTAGGNGSWLSCPNIVNEPIVSGDRIKVVDVDTNEQLSYRVPLLTINVDRSTDVVSGKAPAGDAVELEATDNTGPLFGRPPFDVVSHVSARPDGTYSYDFNKRGADLIAGTALKVHTTTMGGRIHVHRIMTVPGIFIYIGESTFQGYTQPYNGVHMTLTKGGNTVATGNGVGSDFLFSGMFTGRFADANNEPYRVKGGEWFSAPSLGPDESWQIPAIKPNINLATDVVSGTCFANGPWLVETQSGAFDYGMTSGSGAFSTDLSSQGGIASGDELIIGCLTSGGDAVLQDMFLH